MVKPRTVAEEAFLWLGEGARLWLVEASAIGASRIRAKMAAAVELAALVSVSRVDPWLGVAAAAGRFGETDLVIVMIVDHRAVSAGVTRVIAAEVLRVLLAEEARGRDEATRASRRKQARLTAGKTFSSWREADSSIPLPAQQALAGLEWVHRRESLALSGPSGTGRTHFVEARAHKAIDEGLRVAWYTQESLEHAVSSTAVAGSIGRTIARITRCDVIVVEDIGMLPSGQAAGEDSSTLCTSGGVWL